MTKTTKLMIKKSMTRWMKVPQLMATSAVCSVAAVMTSFRSVS